MINIKCISLQEDFLKDAIMMQARFLIDKRNLKFDTTEEYAFAS